ncbi:MAG: ribosome biogenesis/translation initiation ATPase RLI [Nanoarchaeota archaeon]
MPFRKRIAVIDRDKCHPQECGNYLCAKLCPVNRAGADCIYPGDDTGKKARIDEFLCTGCGICPARCPFGAITIINLPSQLDKPPVYRYGENLFELYSLPTPLFGSVTGILGKNGIGKSTALKILANLIKPNLGKWNNPPEFKEVLQYFRGTELQRFLEKSQRNEVSLSYKPQQVDLIPKQYSGSVRELLQRIAKNGRLEKVTEQLQLDPFLDNPLSQISGGELQKVAIAAAALKDANIYLFDEPTSYLDIKQRLQTSNFIRSLASQDLVGKETAVLAIEHDLIILDYLTDFLNIMYGHEGAYGVVSGVKSSREGINTFLDGYLREENVRFRDHPIKFEKVQERQRGKAVPLLTWKNVEKKLGNFQLRTQEGILNKNEIVGILGENGIGKTSFVKIVAGLLPPDNGFIDKEIKVSYKPQYLETDSGQLVAEFLPEAVHKYTNQLIAPLGIEALLARKLNQLSGGELQRVAIARCLSQEAQLFLLDEPSAYLDVEQRLIVSKVIKHVAQEREVTILVVDHDLMFIDYVSDRLIVITGEPARQGLLQGPFWMEEGMNLFLQELGITLRRDQQSHRPRINKVGSVKDREQREQNKWYYS